jgi:hypothetical protein
MPFPRLRDVHATQETLATIGCEPRISADSHMTEPPDLWEKWLPPALCDRAPHFQNRGTASGYERAGGWDPMCGSRTRRTTALAPEFAWAW